jgi:pimeloyl-ACP methyl ester carboxylesterase
MIHITHFMFWMRFGFINRVWLAVAISLFSCAASAETYPVFRGGLNWYRNVDRNWELMAPWSSAKVTVPALYMAGEQDLVVKFPGMDQLIANLKQFVPQLQKTIILPDCGHWTQQESPNEVNSALITFLKSQDPK